MRTIIIALALAVSAVAPAAAQESNNVAAAPASAENTVMTPGVDTTAANEVLLPADEAAAADPLAEDPTVTVRRERVRFPWGLLGLIGLIGLLGRRRP